MKNYHKILGLTFLAAIAAFTFSCNTEEENGIAEGKAKVNVFLVDAPADYDAVWVEVIGVDILPKGENEDNGSAWINLGNDAADDNMINLLDLVAGNSAKLGEVEVPAGEISQVRLILGDNNYLLKGEQRIDLTTPSAQQSGLKIKIDKPLQSGISYDLILDFDAGKSIVRAGNSGQYILKPVLRAIAEESATIQGVITPLEAAPIRVLAVIGEDTVSTFTSENGSFMIRGLSEGNYSVTILPNELYKTMIIDDVMTERGKIKTIDPIELELATDE
ncbi:DUF4382 domain-containing protein [Belliella sp. R4-6]|uniref:DUF4382 domain-containing protein n=1 Tax=Belliella alkalica TaxID=1730871 RepID=A0ABS9VH22_9BACT|nr:DUF4382 domain-containing protein [Belliella alkalica]MCH7415744.1 DUF4382 domain-containing protein [Belliella alkalica]